MKTISLNVKNLDCAACAEKIEKALMRHDGIKGRTANAIALSLGIKNVKAQLLPEDKLNVIKSLESSG
jgi:cation transport ATPase